MTELHETVLARFAGHHDHCAVSKGRTDTTYAELYHRMALLQRQISGKVAVGILSTRCLEAYVAVLCCFVSGIKFVPMNPALPRERLLKIAEAGDVEIIVGDESTVERALDLGLPVTDLFSDNHPAGAEIEQLQTGQIEPSAVAYQMFTSGSTGVPKGVPISYASLSHYVKAISRRLRRSEGGRYSQLFDLSFDLAMHDIFVAVSQGGTLVPAGPMDLLMPHKYIEKSRIDHWFSVPVLAMVAARGHGGTGGKGGRDGKGDKDGKANSLPPHLLQTALFCGEALPTDYALGFRKFIADGGPLYNLYGPTEATIAFTAKQFDPQQSHFPTVPLGPAFGDNQLAVELESGTVATIAEGVTGELLLGGPQVFAGYDPDLGDDMFVLSEGVRFYRSGDLVEVTGGEIIHLGRKDSQIKLHGYRIELGEIEAVFRTQFGCSSAAAVVIGAGEQGRIVVAYEHPTTIDDLSPLQAVLPDYMIPKATMRLDSMPTNINGKIHRKALASLPWPT